MHPTIFRVFDGICRAHEIHGAVIIGAGIRI